MRIVCGPPTALRISCWNACAVVGFFHGISLGQPPDNVRPSPIYPSARASVPASEPSATPLLVESNAQLRPDAAPVNPEFADPISRVQGGLPAELILPPPSRATLALEQRFVRAEIDPQLPLSLAVGRPKILQFKETPLRIFLPSDDVVTAEILDQKSGREIAITGRKAGTTTLTFWFEDRSSPEGTAIISYLVQVYQDPLLTRPISNLQDEINASFSNCLIELTELGGRLVVKGQAKDTVQVVQILQILAGARGVSGGLTRPVNPPTVTSALNFNQQNDQLSQEEDAALRRETLDPVALARAGIVNLIRVPGEQQVMLRVTVAEVNRNAARSIGLDLSFDDGNGSVFNTWTGALSNGPSGRLLSSLDSGQIRLAIEALRKMDLSKTLAEPNLVTMNGMPAANVSFLEGQISKLPMKLSAQGGIKFDLAGGRRNYFTHAYSERSLSFAFNYKQQDPFSQLDVGAQLFLDPLVLGIWYRGLPTKNELPNNESFIALLGVSLENGLDIGYSYDITISKLGLRNSGGAHEISLTYTFLWGDPTSRNQRERVIPCFRY